MVAVAKTRRVVCTIVRVPQEPYPTANRMPAKPSALLPWADPYIAGLVRRLQQEVRAERSSLAASGRPASEPPTFDDRGAVGWLNDSSRSELEPPSPAFDSDWDWFELPRWKIDGEPVE